jgi:hypothetical protein
MLGGLHLVNPAFVKSYINFYVLIRLKYIIILILYILIRLLCINNAEMSVLTSKKAVKEIEFHF